jgi:hypothetical protein
MNGWDIFTYVCCALLAGSALLIFVFFLRDAGDVIRGSQEEDSRREEES